jgi:hypothetical protein
LNCDGPVALVHQQQPLACLAGERLGVNVAARKPSLRHPIAFLSPNSGDELLAW